MSSSASSAHVETFVVGRYRVHTVASNSEYVTQEGFEVERPEHRVRAKGYVKPCNEAGRSELSQMIKNQVRLTNTAARLEQRRSTSGVSSSSGGVGGDGGACVQDLNSSSDPQPLTEKELFLLNCFRHTRLLTDRVQTTSRVYVFKDLMPCSLQTILSNGRLDEDGAFYYFYQLLKAVHYFHENGYIHRNISAVHIYIGDKGALLRLGGASSCWDEGKLDLDGTHGLSSTNYSDTSNTSSGNGPEGSRRRTPTPQPGSYGICSHCGRDVPIVTEPQLCKRDGAEAPGTALPGGTPPLNAITTTCRYCGVVQNRMHLLQTIVGTPAFLPPEAIAYQPLQSAMNTSSHSSLTASHGPANTPGSETASWTGITAGQSRDMWSCGVVLYFMLTCRLPFDPRSNNTSISSHVDSAMSPNCNGSSSVGGSGAELSLTPQQTWEMCNRIAAVDYTVPAYVTDNARVVLESLLIRDPRRRPTAARLMALPCFARVRESGI